MWPYLFWTQSLDRKISYGSVYAWRSLVQGAADYVSTAVGFLDAETGELGAQDGGIWIE